LRPQAGPKSTPKVCVCRSISHRTHRIAANTTDTPGTVARDPVAVWLGIKVLLALPRRGGPAPTQVLGRGRHMGATSDRAWPPKAALGCGPLRSPGRQSPPDQWVGRPWLRPKTPVVVTNLGCGQGAPVDRPRAAVVPPPQPGVTGLPVPASWTGLVLRRAPSAARGDRPRLVIHSHTRSDPFSQAILQGGP
jgi:hypothetical protein